MSEIPEALEAELKDARLAFEQARNALAQAGGNFIVALANWTAVIKRTMGGEQSADQDQ